MHQDNRCLAGHMTKKWVNTSRYLKHANSMCISAYHHVISTSFSRWKTVNVRRPLFDFIVVYCTWNQEIKCWMMKKRECKLFFWHTALVHVILTFYLKKTLNGNLRNRLTSEWGDINANVFKKQKKGRKTKQMKKKLNKKSKTKQQTRTPIMCQPKCL